MKLDITRSTKMTSLVTIIGMLVANSISSYLVIIVPLGILTILLFSYPGTEKVGIVGMAKHLQTVYAVALIASIGIILMVR